MNSITDIWNNIMQRMGEDLTSTAINTWFSDCEPVDITDNSLVLHTPTQFKRTIIETRFSPKIKELLSDIFSCDFDLVVLTDDEMEAYRIDHPEDNGLPEMDGYTFDQFIVGSSNKFAHAAALAVSKNPGKAYNPLFIYGNSGLGKTHLLLAIGQEIYTQNKSVRLAYVKGDEFTNDLIRAIRENTQEEFHNRYRHLDLLLMDDIQFIAGKQQTQEEFFHTYNSLYEAGAQIVITSDRAPMEMNKLEERLRTRFESGLIADVQPPDIETRLAIIRNKAGQLGLVLSDEVVEYIGENITSDVRKIEGVVKRLTAYKDILNDDITVNSVKRAIKDVIRIGVYIPTPELIIEETARYYSLSPEDLRGQRRTKNMAMARQVSMYLIRSLTNLSLVDIGRLYEGRNHSTVLSSIHKVEDMLQKDPDMAATVRDISSNINAHS